MSNETSGPANKPVPQAQPTASNDGIGPDLGKEDPIVTNTGPAKVSSTHGSGVFPEDVQGGPKVVSSFHGGKEHPDTISYKSATAGNAEADAAAKKAHDAKVAEQSAKANQPTPSNAVNVTAGTYGPATPNGPTSPNNPARPNAVGSIDQRDLDDDERDRKRNR